MSDTDAASDARRGATVVRDRLTQLPDALAETLRLSYFGRLDNHEVGLRTGMSDLEVRGALSAGLFARFYGPVIAQGLLQIF